MGWRSFPTQPLGTGDPLAEMIEIRPGHELEYTLRFPPITSPGLYHPHYHGATAVQAVSGMAGAIIVRVSIDEVPEIAAKDLLLMVNDIGLFPSEDDPDVYTYEPVQNSIWDTLSSQVLLWNTEKARWRRKPTAVSITGDYKLRYFLANGQPFSRRSTTSRRRPTATPRPQAARPSPATSRTPCNQLSRAALRCSRARWCASSTQRQFDDLMPIVVEGHELYLLAPDGTNFEAPRLIEAKSITGVGRRASLLAPANRAEFLLQAGAPRLQDRAVGAVRAVLAQRQPHDCRDRGDGRYPCS